jgi:hypothetical protein
MYSNVIDNIDKKIETLYDIIEYLDNNSIVETIQKYNTYSKELHILGNEIWQVHKPKNVYDIDDSYLNVYIPVLDEYQCQERKILHFHERINDIVPILEMNMNSKDYDMYVFIDKDNDYCSIYNIKNYFESKLRKYELERKQLS